ncbi:hypothetical protein L3Y34_011222 [Caenorhabditis briggsae]|uniref:Uncharacterized protein n=1 Tax=Caenorhabditis briggsae TaxID=6238 RepID=A0AAE8ZR91_CAEBR|nr:hypothetical protein L3Y34_011222 [Caenorhabditis briggsae]
MLDNHAFSIKIHGVAVIYECALENQHCRLPQMFYSQIPIAQFPVTELFYLFSPKKKRKQRQKQSGNAIEANCSYVKAAE